MRVTRTNDQLLLLFSQFEVGLLRHVLRQVLENYQIKPGEMDAKTAAVWYSPRGCQGAQMSAEETQEWLAQLHGFKSARLDLIRRWTRRMSNTAPGRWQLALKLGEAEAFLTVINDHRLLAAARHDIGQAEMDQSLIGEAVQLTPARQAALLEIHLLAWVMEEVLAQLSDRGGS